MLVSLIAKDKDGALDVRKANRDAHFAYIKSTGVVQQAGPILSDAGEMIGSVVILEVQSMADTKDWAASDPYALAGLFESVELLHWNRVIGG